MHQQAAVSAAEDYRKIAAGKFAEKSSSTIENITLLDSLGKNWREFEDIQKGAQSGPLMLVEGTMNLMADGPEKG